MVAINPEPVPNSATATDLTVPSWGFVGDGVFVLLGCASADPASCGTLLDQQTAWVYESDRPDVVVSAPDTRLLVPEQQVGFVAAGGGPIDNPGGGHLMAAFAGRQQRVPNHEVTRFEAWPSGRTDGFLGVYRCSDLVDEAMMLAYCDYQTGANVDVIRDAAVSSSLLHGRSTVTTDPTWWGSAVRVGVRPDNPWHEPVDLTWSLLDATGARVAGPVALPVITSNGDQPVSFDLDPQATAKAPLPDGDYRVAWTLTLHHDGVSKTGTSYLPITLDSDPPADRPAVLGAVTEVRPISVAYQTTHWIHYRVQAYLGDRDGVLRVRDSQGRVVLQHTEGNPCASSVDQATCAHPVWDVLASPSRATGVSLPVGTYSATFDLPDSWGRMTRLALPSFRVQDLALVHSADHAPASRLMIDDGAVTGRCSRFRARGASLGRGSVSLRSQATCRSRRGRADQVTRVFQLGTPLVGAIEEGSALDVRTTYFRPRAAGRVALWARVPALGSTWVRLHSHFRPGGRRTVNGTISTSRISDYRGQPVQLRFRVSRGARLDLGRIVVDPTYAAWR